MKLIFWPVGVVVLLELSLGAAEVASNRFGFTGPEIFPIDNQIGLLHAADLDGDGRTDLIVVNNARSRINLLYNQSGQTNSLTPTTRPRRELNELPPDARFRIESIASEKRIAGLVVADLNQNGRPDLAYYGEPRELIVTYNQGSNTWSAPRRWAIDDGLLTPNALTTGDLNGDGRTDLLLLAENHVHWLAQNPDGTLAEPEKIPVSDLVKAVQVLDVDGDGRSDLVLVNWESPTPFRVRLQNAAGQLGPEIYFTLPPIRAYWADQLEANEKTFVMTIAQNSGRAAISQFERQPARALAGNFLAGQFHVLPLQKTDRTRRGVTWADVTGNGRSDLLVAEPESGKLSVYAQSADGSLGSPRRFPTLAGVSDIAVADWDGDGRAEIFVLSPDERQVGVSRFDERDRLPFPTLIPLPGRPLVMAVGARQAAAPPALAVMVDVDGKRSLVTRTATGESRTQKLAENFTANPTTLAFHDVNQDGLADLVALIPYEKVKVLLQQPDGEFAEHDVAPPGGVLEQPWLAEADVDGDGRSELLLPQKNFLRAVILQPETETAGNPTNAPGWRFQVRDQINGAASNSRLVGAASVPRPGQASASLFLLDAERKVLTLCERDASGVWQVVRNLDLPVTGLNRLIAVALGGDAPNSVALLGANTVAWQALTGEVWELVELDGYETPIRDGALQDVISGDLDNDGRKDLVFLETAKNHLDLVIFSKDHRLIPADRWRVFEERTFRGRAGGLPEPREALVADLTGDGKNDLAVVVHDRILVYPQE